MTLKQLVQKLSEKPNQHAEVEFLVFEKVSGSLVCCELVGAKTDEIMRIVARKKKT